MNQKIRRSVSFLGMSILLVAAAAETTRKADFEFIDQKYGDILYALSSWSGIPIIADDTVTGKASFQYAGTGFEKAFDAFIAANRLYAEKKESGWTVSKIAVSMREESIALDAFDSSLAQILERLSRKSGKTILFDILPGGPVSIHIQAATVEELAVLLMKPFSGYIVESEDSHLYIRKKTDQAQTIGKESHFTLVRSNEGYALEVTQARASEILDRLCREEGVEYSNLIRTDPVIANLKISGKPFAKTLDVVLEQAGCAAIKENDLYYFLPGTEKDPAGKIRDKELGWNVVTVSNIRQKDAVTLLQSRFQDIKFIVAPDSRTILTRADDATKKEIEAFLSIIDRAIPDEIIKLKYISASEFLKAVPPLIRKDELVETGTGNSFFYTGPADLKKILLNELKEIDKPKTRINYDMLIIQYDDSNDLSWGMKTDARQLEPGDRNSIAGSFSNLLNLNFDVITLFGYRFAAQLSAALAENRARIFTDTTLHGISGENIKFQNTSTYRYRDSNIDAETGKTIYTGVTREIVSGVMIELNGWVSGDSMVTMAINATISKRGADVSSANGNPPPTSEKSVTTRINTANGNPVILSGLVQNDESIVEQRVPLISKIPVIGWAFRSISKTKSKSEMVIYIVPHVSNGPDAKEKSRQNEETAYERLVVPFISERKK